MIVHPEAAPIVMDLALPRKPWVEYSESQGLAYPIAAEPFDQGLVAGVLVGEIDPIAGLTWPF